MHHAKAFSRSRIFGFYGWMYVWQLAHWPEFIEPNVSCEKRTNEVWRSLPRLIWEHQGLKDNVANTQGAKKKRRMYCQVMWVIVVRCEERAEWTACIINPLFSSNPIGFWLKLSGWRYLCSQSLDLVRSHKMVARSTMWNAHWESGKEKYSCFWKVVSQTKTHLFER